MIRWEKNEFENSDEDRTMQEDNPGYSLVRNRWTSPRERNTGERQGEQSNPENERITRCTRPTKGLKPERFRDMYGYW